MDKSKWKQKVNGFILILFMASGTNSLFVSEANSINKKIDDNQTRIIRSIFLDI